MDDGGRYLLFSVMYFRNLVSALRLSVRIDVSVTLLVSRSSKPSKMATNLQVNTSAASANLTISITSLRGLH